jgi:hypothetical protein
MSGHKGKCGCVPLVVAHGEVRVADAAVFNVNFNLIVLKRTGIEGESSKLPPASGAARALNLVMISDVG